MPALLQTDAAFATLKGSSSSSAPAPQKSTKDNASLSVNLCSMCDRPAKNLYCARCDCSFYCSKTCQIDDAPLHKLLCRSFKDFSADKAPPSHYRFILFHDRKDKPEFVWLHCPSLSSPVLPQRIAHVDQRGCSPKIVWFADFNPLLGRSRKRMCLIGHAKTGSDGKYHSVGARNGSLMTVDNVLYFAEEFRGPLLLFSMDGHLNMMDFRNSIDLMRISIATEHKLPLLGATPVRGVRINCIGDVVLGRRPRFETYECALFEHKVTDENLRLPLAEKVGLRLRCHTIPAIYSMPWRDRHIQGNPHFSYDMNISWTILKPNQWMQPVKSIVVTREDGRGLHPSQMEAFCQYIYNISFPSITEVDFDANQPPKRDIRQELDEQFKDADDLLQVTVNQEGWQGFWQKYKTRMCAEYYFEASDTDSEVE
ncbi:hypothetical protein FB567DRAFT_602752 [Paraphoma chrysanthemicola]|uniref:MYND-type domain-containing protein n=1 Tax=Paraphoma chrysanthemicola TaxID=798071 RepID=A0A8K0R7X0_9PLEO|nr:hypothetical protein FB567DRAFT_602752 [Paraphoma chrysanthemicola]